MNTLKVTNSNGLSFNVHIIRKGDSWGLTNSLIHDEDTAMVEFYDTRYDHTPLGQFVSRYDADTLLDRHPHSGLDLDSGIPSWTVDGDAMNQVIKWLQSELQVNA